MGRTSHILCPLSHLFLCMCTSWGYMCCSLRKRRQPTRLLQSGTASVGETKIQTLFHTHSPTLLFPCSAVAILSFSLGIKRHKTYKMYMTDCRPSQRLLFAHQFQPQSQGSAWRQELATSLNSPASQAEIVLGPKFAATAECVGMVMCWRGPSFCLRDS